MIGKDVSPAVGAATQFQPGQSGNPAGRARGSKNLSSIVRDILESDIDFDKLNVTEATNLRNRYKNSKAAEALVYVALTKALATGDVAAMRWLQRAGYGDKLTFDGEIKHEGIVIYKPEKYPRQDVAPTTTEPVAPAQPTPPAAEQRSAPPPAPNPDLEGIA